MKKFKPVNTKLTSQETAEPDAKKTAPERLTNLSAKTNLANRPPKSIRFTQDELAMAQVWLGELQQKTKRPLTLARVLRALIHMKDGINQKALIESILENT